MLFYSVLDLWELLNGWWWVVLDHVCISFWTLLH